jgi:hypothetical protein
MYHAHYLVFVTGIYLTSVMALTSLSVILAVVVSNISNRGRKDKVMPRALKTFIIGLAKLVRFRYVAMARQLQP